MREKTLKAQILISSGKFKYKNAESNKGDGALPCDISDFFGVQRLCLGQSFDTLIHTHTQKKKS